MLVYLGLPSQTLMSRHRGEATKHNKPFTPGLRPRRLISSRPSPASVLSSKQHRRQYVFGFPTRVVWVWTSVHSVNLPSKAHIAHP